jgi:hypothetical protein
MVILITPLLVCVVGALVYALANPKLSELGRWAYVVGLFWTVAYFASAGGVAMLRGVGHP